MQKITMADVAKAANVSKSTVSQYLNKRYEYMSEETKKRIAQAIEELGYQPNFVARSLKQKSTSTIGVIVFNILHMLTTQVLRAIEDVCQERDFHVIVCNTDDDPEKEKKYIEMLRAKQVDGLIIFPTGRNYEWYEKMVNESFPLVFVDRMVPDLPVDAVLLDNYKAAKLAVDHLADVGYERIGIVTPPLVSYNIPRTERVKGFKLAVKARGLQVMDEYIVNLEIPCIKEGLTKLFRSGCPPQALFAINDLTLMEVLHFVQENQLRIPYDIALISIDDVPFASIYTPTLTTIAQPAFEMGRKAAERLFQKIERSHEEKEPQILRLEPVLKKRQSVSWRSNP
ncbi:LacI family DNA-binding transcriptional regulator [Anoxybacteroides rupiense]|uniref:LacI family DNA-binding transcriptional regulator n=1 Tax=Anoxybacteroides rupiense TaxID=311460 RepID=UPI001F08E47D|nr:substrate-binding domain-containing protein [Anoxybacillus rupiensis]